MKNTSDKLSIIKEVELLIFANILGIHPSADAGIKWFDLSSHFLAAKQMFGSKIDYIDWPDSTPFRLDFSITHFDTLAYLCSLQSNCQSKEFDF